jgi:hypothetical protein
MKIISHRGAWNTNDEKNTVTAFEHSFKNDFGTETDIRDYKGELVIAHDMATESSIPLSLFFEIYRSFNPTLPLALNIKADGLQKPLTELLQHYDIKNYFFFDMSVPDTLGYRQNNLHFYTRQSEFEPQPALYENTKGIWLDCFTGIWYDTNLIKDHIDNGKTVALVSPDLHKRDYLDFWSLLKTAGLDSTENMILCTDFPFDARSYFKNN